SLVYEARHGQGFSSFSTRRGDLHVTATQIVDPNDPVKLVRLRIRNEGAQTASLRVYAYAEWVLGTSRTRSAPYVVPAYHASGIMMARNAYSLDYGDRTAFLASDGPAQSATSSRLDFIGQDGSVQFPETVLAGRDLSGLVEPGYDPCAALARDVEIAPGDSADMLWLLGDASSSEEAIALVARHRERNFEDRLAENARLWDDFLDTL